MRMSFSRVETWMGCPYRFKLRYLDGLETLPNWDDPANPLIIGTALHHGIEKGVAEAVQEYLMSFPVAGELHENEAIKLQELVPKVKTLVDMDAQFERPLQGEGFLGFVDYWDPKTGWLLDFKYSNNRSHYLDSPQVHVYKHLAEKLWGVHVEHIGYLFVPKVSIRQKKTETLYQFRRRLLDELSRAEPEICEVKYSGRKVDEFFRNAGAIGDAVEFPKIETKLCDWCEYQRFCEEGEDYMILPKNEKVKVGSMDHHTMWIYGQPFSGKTTLANKFPDAILLNTDGNVGQMDSPHLIIRDEGERVRKFAWEVFKDAVEELGQGKSGFRTIVVDLIEDIYEDCRLYMYDKLGITHESDDPYKAWDKVRTEFLTTMKRLMTLPGFEYVILVSHEDTSRDFTRRNGDKLTTVRPNIQEKVANKLAGMVEVVVHCVVKDGVHLLEFKNDAYVFGGGRIPIKENEIPNDLGALLDNIGVTDGAPSRQDALQEEDKPAPVRRTRKPRQETSEPATASADEAVEKARETRTARRQFEAVGKAEEIPVSTSEEEEDGAEPAREEPVRRRRREI